jgi:hypothetical protein
VQLSFCQHDFVVYKKQVLKCVQLGLRNIHSTELLMEAANHIILESFCDELVEELSPIRPCLERLFVLHLLIASRLTHIMIKRRIASRSIRAPGQNAQASIFVSLISLRSITLAILR